MEWSSSAKRWIGLFIGIDMILSFIRTRIALLTLAAAPLTVLGCKGLASFVVNLSCVVVCVQFLRVSDTSQYHFPIFQLASFSSQSCVCHLASQCTLSQYSFLNWPQLERTSRLSNDSVAYIDSDFYPISISIGTAHTLPLLMVRPLFSSNETSIQICQTSFRRLLQTISFQQYCSHIAQTRSSSFLLVFDSSSNNQRLSNTSDHRRSQP